MQLENNLVIVFKWKVEIDKIRPFVFALVYFDKNAFTFHYSPISFRGIEIWWQQLIVEKYNQLFWCNNFWLDFDRYKLVNKFIYCSKTNVNQKFNLEFDWWWEINRNESFFFFWNCFLCSLNIVHCFLVTRIHFFCLFDSIFKRMFSFRIRSMSYTFSHRLLSSRMTFDRSQSLKCFTLLICKCVRVWESLVSMPVLWRT